MYKKKKIELYKFKGCENCQRNCLWNGLVAIRRIAEKDKTKFPCNSKIDLIEMKKDIQSLIGEK